MRAPCRLINLPLLSISNCCIWFGKRANEWSYGTMACVWALKKLIYQIPSMPMITGIFSANGLLRKWLSISCPPSSRRIKLSIPTYSAIGKPMALHNEYRPPTQSQISNILAVSMPNLATSLALVETATKCLATSACVATLRNQFRADWALVMVSWVVKVFEATINRVVSGFSFSSVVLRSVPSTLETKCASRPSIP